MAEKAIAIALKIESGIAIASMSQPKTGNAFTQKLLNDIQEIIAVCKDTAEISAL